MIDEWTKGERVIDSIHEILSRSKYGLNSPMARLNIIKLLLKEYDVGWIDVESEMPPDESIVLVYYQSLYKEGVDIRLVIDGEFMDKDFDAPATHWMALPVAPSEDV